MNNSKEIFDAIEEGDFENFKRHFTSDARINMQDERGNSLLMNAVIHEQAEIAKFLINLKPDLYLYNNEGFTVFPIAESIEDKTLFHLLLKQCLSDDDRIFLIGYHAIPNTPKEDIEGAFINCYLVDTDYENARDRSLSLVEELDWKILSVEEETEIDWLEVEEGDERKQYVEQVIIDKEVLVIYSYERDEQE